MKTTIKITMISFVAGLALYSCSKDETEDCLNNPELCAIRYIPTGDGVAGNNEIKLDSVQVDTKNVE